MGRRIVTRQLESGTSKATVDGYQDRLLKYIPADINAAWIALSGIVKSTTTIPQNAVLWVLFVILLILTPIWIWIGTKESKKPVAKTQIVVSTVAFFIWVFALGEPFATSFKDFYQPVYGSLLLILYTLIVAKIVPTEG
ncbi:hypothetical protein [Merismopedia glauca]|uniref:Uncharacterized protein n=1 Tax=Merismopedia glauca CCAP 1448/3 TaxID=1296344 RepID=A0A2T1C3C6_9CYAN|nr:hypothetical protein [Merismopedia glauca]PSB02775.1 hypothetical protein C7B64_11525 [Merismopedia glauca CCAP 1448/3]